MTCFRGSSCHACSRKERWRSGSSSLASIPRDGTKSPRRGGHIRGARIRNALREYAVISRCNPGLLTLEGMSHMKIQQPSRRGLLMMAAATGVTLAVPRVMRAASPPPNFNFGGDLSAIRATIERQRSEAIKRLQDWIALPSIAAEDRNMKEGAQMMMDLLKDAGFQSEKLMLSGPVRT